MNPADVPVEIIGEMIIDVSFIPAHAQKECTSGYQWMVKRSVGHGKYTLLGFTV